MGDHIDEIKTQKSQNFSVRWTRSSGRVVEQAKPKQKQQPKDINPSTSYPDLVQIYRRFLDLQDEESGDLADAVSYGLRLFESAKGKHTTRNEASKKQTH